MGASPFGFENLIVYQKAREFRKRIYKLVKLLPPDERYALAGQMRRAAVSVTNNIAESYGRYTFKDRVNFCRISRGSIMELVDDFNVCEDEEYAKAAHLQTLRDDAVEVLRLLNGFIDYLRRDAKSKRTKRKNEPDAS